MNRPIYESDADRQNEQAMADFIAARYKLTMHKMPMKLYIDYVGILDGKAKAFFEMRQRKNAMHQYPTFMIGMHKVQSAYNLAAVTGLPCMLIVQWTDHMGMCKLPPPERANLYWDWGGSDRREDEQDWEPMAYWDISVFKVLK